MITQADCLNALNDVESGSVDLFYADPPFFTNRDYADANGAFSDRWDSLEEYLYFMRTRIAEMRRCLSKQGAFWLHCDQNASHYLKVICDEIFGRENFRNEIVWCYTGPSTAAKQFPAKHDTLFWYSNGKEWHFDANAVRIPYKNGAVHAGGFGDHKITKEDVERISERGKIPQSWWTESEGRMSPVGRCPKERVGYPTQKPIALVARIILACTGSGQLVFDPFCGSGTTLVAARRLGRRFAGCDVSADACRLARERVEAEMESLV